MYGEGATYDSIEGRFRIIRKEAEKLKVEIDSGQRPPAPPRGTGEKRSPRKPRQHSIIDLDTVESGRITKSKSANSSPSKRRSTAQIKRELLESSTSTSNSGDTGTSDHVEEELLTADFSFDPSIISSDPLYHSFDLPSAHTTTSMTLDNSGQWLDEYGEPEQYA